MVDLDINYISDIKLNTYVVCSRGCVDHWVQLLFWSVALGVGSVSCEAGGVHVLAEAGPSTHLPQT